MFPARSRCYCLTQKEAVCAGGVIQTAYFWLGSARRPREAARYRGRKGGSRAAMSRYSKWAQREHSAARRIAITLLAGPVFLGLLPFLVAGGGPRLAPGHKEWEQAQEDGARKE